MSRTVFLSRKNPERQGLIRDGGELDDSNAARMQEANEISFERYQNSLKRVLDGAGAAEDVKVVRLMIKQCGDEQQLVQICRQCCQTYITSCPLEALWLLARATSRCDGSAYVVQSLDALYGCALGLNEELALELLCTVLFNVCLDVPNSSLLIGSAVQKLSGFRHPSYLSLLLQKEDLETDENWAGFAQEHVMAYCAAGELSQMELLVISQILIERPCSSTLEPIGELYRIICGRLYELYQRGQSINPGLLKAVFERIVVAFESTDGPHELANTLYYAQVQTAVTIVLKEGYAPLFTLALEALSQLLEHLFSAESASYLSAYDFWQENAELHALVKDGFQREMNRLGGQLQRQPESERNCLLLLRIVRASLGQNPRESVQIQEAFPSVVFLKPAVERCIFQTQNGDFSASIIEFLKETARALAVYLWNPMLLFELQGPSGVLISIAESSGDQELYHDMCYILGLSAKGETEES